MPIVDGGSGVVGGMGCRRTPSRGGSWRCGVSTWHLENRGGSLDATVLAELGRRYRRAGVNQVLDPVPAPLTLGCVLKMEGRVTAEAPWNLALSAGIELARSLIRGGNLGYFDIDLDRGVREPINGDHDFVGIGRLELVF